jgi:hypothetical protein
LLGEIQTAYAAEDLLALRTTLTPELLSYFSEELAANASRGVINRVTDVKLIHGDLAEAFAATHCFCCIFGADVSLGFRHAKCFVSIAQGPPLSAGSPVRYRPSGGSGLAQPPLPGRFRPTAADFANPPLSEEIRKIPALPLSTRMIAR